MKKIFIAMLILTGISLAQDSTKVKLTKEMNAIQNEWGKLQGLVQDKTNEKNILLETLDKINKLDNEIKIYNENIQMRSQQWQAKKAERDSLKEK